VREVEASLLLAQIELSVPGLTGVLIASPTSTIDCLPVATDLAHAVTLAGGQVRLVFLGAEEKLMAADAESRDEGVFRGFMDLSDLRDYDRAMRKIVSFGGVQVVVGRGLLDDGPTLLASRLVEGMVAVVKRGSTARRDLRRMGEWARDAKLPVMGAVLIR